MRLEAKKKKTKIVSARINLEDYKLLKKKKINISKLIRNVLEKCINYCDPE
jgi:post-segregation antitoxin (ccd killing protein)